MATKFRCVSRAFGSCELPPKHVLLKPQHKINMKENLFVLVGSPLILYTGNTISEAVHHEAIQIRVAGVVIILIVTWAKFCQ